MSAYNKNDMKLLEEAYNVRLLREQAPHMTLSQLEQRVHLMSESELNYINTVMDRILNEFWGQQALAGLKNVGSAAMGGLKSVGGAVKDAVVGGAKQVANAGAGALAAGKAGAQQVASNVGNIYQKGQIQQRQSQALQKGLKAIEQLRGFIQQAENDGVLSGGQNFEDMSISELIQYLQGSQEVSASNAANAAKQGFTKGAGAAMKQAYQGQQAQTPQA
ncbi:MAG: hypothetical protein ABFD07_02090 [Methanobacterium sp.]